MDIMTLFYFSLKCYNAGLFIKEKQAPYKYRKWYKQTERNLELLKYKKSEKCYICGNGPSLKKVNLDELDGDTIVMNDHWRIAPQYKILPTYYIINDDGYAEDELKDRLLGFLHCYPEIPHIATTKIGSAIDKEDPGHKVNMYYYSPIGRTFKHNYPIDFTKCTYYTWNVVTASIQLAIYLGYKEIYLLGCDYSLFASKYLQHAYDKNGDKVPCPFNLRDMLYKYTFTTHIHYEVARYAQEHGIKVVNMTSESLLDAYEMDFNSKF